MKRRTRLWLLLVAGAVVSTLAAAVAFVAHSESALRWAFARLQAAVPGQLEAAAVRGRLAGPITLEGLRYRQEGMALALETLTLDWSPWALLAGVLRVTDIEARGLHLESAAAGRPAAAVLPPAGAWLPLGWRIDAARVSDIVFASARGTHWLSRLELAGARGRPDGVVDLAALHLVHEGFEATLGGRLRLPGTGRYEAEVHWSLHPPAPYATLAGGGRVAGDGTRLRMDQTLAAPLAARLTAVISGLDTDRPHWQADLEIAKLDAPRLHPAWPAAALAGRLQAHGEGSAWRAEGRLEIRGARVGDWRVGFALARAAPRWRLERLALGLLAARAEVLTAWGDYHETSGRFALDARWRAFEVTLPRPVAGRPLRVASPAGRLRLTARYPRGAGAGFRLEQLDLHAGRSVLALSGRRHSDGDFELAWRLAVEELGRFLPGRASGALQAEGRLRRAGLTYALAGTLGARALAFDDKTVETLAADVALGESAAVRLDLAAEGLVLSGVHLARLDATVRGVKTRHRAVISARGETGATDLHLEIAGTLDKSGWRGAIDSGRIRSAAFGGAWSPRRRAVLAVEPKTVTLEESCWRHAGSQGEICLAGGWRRRAGIVSLEFSAQALPVGPSIQGLLPVSVTAEGRLEGRGRFQIPDSFETITGELALALSPGYLRHTPRGAAAAVDIVHRGARFEARAESGRARLSGRLELEDGGRLALEADLPVALLGFGHASATTPLAGAVTAEIRDLAPMAIFLPAVASPQGRFEAELRLGGTLDNLQLTGHAALQGGSFSLPALGIRLSEVRLDLESTGGGVLAVRGEAHSGREQGRLALRGRIDFGRAPHWQARLEIEARRFEAANIPPLHLLADAELVLEARPPVLEVSGELRIPEALVRPPDQAKLVGPSPDAVIVAGGEEGRLPQSRWQTVTRLRVVLGDKVRFEGFDFRGWITGALEIEDRPPRPTTGLGELRVSAGHYRVYDQSLVVERGRFVFTGGPIDDPGLDVRAVRRVDAGRVTVGVQARGSLKAPRLTLFSEPPMDEADILSYLTLGRPLTQASQAQGELLYRAASGLGLAGGELLARRLGSLFGIEDTRIEPVGTNADPALILGTYLSPRLYVSYGVGLFESFNVLRVRYQLGRRWLLEAQSSVSASGADIIYTLER